VPIYLYVSRMRKIVILTGLLITILPLIVLHYMFICKIRGHRTKWIDASVNPPYEYEISRIYPSGFKLFDYLPGGENTFDVGIGFLRFPLIRYTVEYTAVNGRFDPVFGKEVESKIYMSYFPIGIASYY
jgi:hypothetical protein